VCVCYSDLINLEEVTKLDDPFAGDTIPSVEDVCEYLNEKHDLWETEGEIFSDTDDFLDYL